MTPQQAQVISKEALDKFPPVDGYDFEQQCSRLGYTTAATKYAALLEEKDRELARLTTEAEQSLFLYNNMTATIVKRDEEIERLKELVKAMYDGGDWDGFRQQNNL